MKNETGTLCKSYFHLSQFSEFAKLNSASCEFGVEITFSNEEGEPNLEKLKNCLDKWGHYIVY